MRSSRPDPVNPDSGAEQPARLVHPMLVALPVAFSRRAEVLHVGTDAIHRAGWAAAP